MFSIETYNESADEDKRVLSKTNDSIRSKIFVFGMAVVLFVEWLWLKNVIGSSLAIFLRVCYIACIFIYFRKSLSNDKNTIIASDKGLYFRLSLGEHWKEDQYLMLEWEGIDCCEYREGSSLKIVTKLQKQYQDNYSFEGIKLTNLRLQSASIETKEFFEECVLLIVSRRNARRWFKLMKHFPVHVADVI